MVNKINFIKSQDQRTDKDILIILKNFNIIKASINSLYKKINNIKENK